MKNFALLLLLAAMPFGVQGDMSMLSQVLKQKMRTRSNLVECSDVYTSQFCPNSSPPPNVVFDAGEGTVTGSTKPCCKGNFLQCQNQMKTALCRDMQYYTITPDQGNMEEVCPPTTPECTCQQALAAEKFLKLKLCPRTTPCCPTCECHGDPHCTAFDRSKSVTWAVCDDRDATCLHGPTTCPLTLYDNQPCVWTHIQTGYSACMPASGTREPSMIMYEKTYKSYFNSADNTLHSFRLTLTLTTYGNIGNIKIEDQGTIIVFGLATGSGGKCVASPQYPLDSNNRVLVNKLPSGVQILLECANNGKNAPQRWDILSVKDPWFTPAQIAGTPDQVFGGFCSTGKIAENGDSLNTQCRIMDRQLSLYYGCTSLTPMATCKERFCSGKGSALKFPGTTPQKTQCLAFVNSNTELQNFLKAACALNFLESKDPTQCDADSVCNKCVDDISDFPDEISIILGKTLVSPTSAPTQPCPPVGLLQTGLNRKRLSTLNSGVQIEFLNALTNVWEGVFAVLDEEVEACGGCNNIMLVNGSDSSVQPLLTPGQYRIRQCTGYDSDPLQDVCEGALGYNATVWYNNPLSGGAVSLAYGTLFDSGYLVCSATKFPFCPLNYQCCIWDKATQPGAWASCMNLNHGGKDYPKCGN